MRARSVACCAGALLLSLLACDSGKSNESSTGSAETGAAESSSGKAPDLPSACEAWCQHELDCHPSKAPPFDLCFDTCTGEADGATPECIEATAQWYACRAELMCGVGECPETEIDLHCSDAG